MRIKGKLSEVLHNITFIFAILLKTTPFYLGCITIIQLILAVLPISQVYITKRIIDEVTIIFNGDQGNQLIYSLLLLQFILLLSLQTLSSLYSLLSIKLQNKVNYYFQKRLNEKIVKLPLELFDRSEIYNKLGMTFTTIESRALNLFFTMVDIVRNVITLGGFLSFFFAIHWSLAIALLVLIVPSLYFNFIYSKLKFFRIRSLTPVERKMGYLSTLLRGRLVLKELKMFGHAPNILGKWSELYWKVKKDKEKLELKNISYNISSQILTNTLTYIILGILLFLGSVGKIKISHYVALSDALLKIQGSLSSLAYSFSTVYESSLFLNEAREILNTPDEKRGENDFPEMLREGIKVSNLSFRYSSSDRYILKNINLEIKQGEKVAIVGDNGAGKSSLVKCLVGLYDVKEGDIYYDGVNQKDIDIGQLRNNISVLFQDFIKYELSVKENIGFGNVKFLSDDDKITAAAKKSGLDGIINQFDKKYETVLGTSFENGVDLSGGQWQKVALSRSLMRDAPIVVFDEPTSALDPLSELEIFKGFLNISENKTSIMITHRLGICKMADRIYVMKNGEIIEQGNHESLMQLNGHYKTMFDIQAKWYKQEMLA
ncbi:ABC transporter ATP-binding protein [Paenibacillus sp. S-12]|uniref:ABC transporter ATP-binding protein n=1 Tax=Paenibacillus sp. S-12 TaxID=3031371 RepID=UPI0025A019ED|nr:ABC transporter ATP-binding protein [Paenibacillus sp. S-12]